MAKKKNKNIVPIVLADLSKEADYNDFKYKKHFILLCNLIPNSDKEKIEIEYIRPNLEKKPGLVYIMVIEKKLFKIGQTINTMKDRVQSYNCGKVEHRINGTASTTNFFILQSILKINKKVKVYVMFPEQPTFEVFGKKISSSHPPVKIVEKKLIKEFINDYGKKPIGITQK